MAGEDLVRGVVLVHQQLVRIVDHAVGADDPEQPFAESLAVHSVLPSMRLRSPKVYASSLTMTIDA
ncbi:hypothetical protein HRbin26_02382 [bacterium HR26]|nr:hypothetical protein HRbin26_02382 [bacterium HR26]